MAKATKILKKFAKWSVKNAPKLFSAGSVAGIIAGDVMLVKGASTATRIIVAEEQKRGEELTFKEKAQLTWKCFLPGGLASAASIFCGVRGTFVADARTANEAAKAAAATASKEMIASAYDDYRVEHGDKPISEKPKTTVYVSGQQQFLIREHRTGQTFRDTPNNIMATINKLNYHLLRKCGCISFNEFLDEFNLKHVPDGDDIGFNIDKGLIDIWFDSDMEYSDGIEPCLVMKFYSNSEPFEDYVY